MASRIVAARPRRTPAGEVHSAALLQVQDQLQTIRSLLAVAVRALDEIADPRRLDPPETCERDDVATVVRLAIERLSQAQQGLDEVTP